MPINFTDIIRPNDAPNSIAGFNTVNTTAFQQAVSDGSDLTSVVQNDDTCNVFGLPFSETGNFNDASAVITGFNFNLRCRAFKGHHEISVRLETGTGNFGTQELVTQGPLGVTETLTTETFLVNPASDPLTPFDIKGLTLQRLDVFGAGGGTGALFRLTIFDIFINVFSEVRLGTREITLNSGRITLDSGKITVQ